MTSYTVQKGDTLYKIAKTHYGDGKQWNRIVAANPGVSRPRSKPARNCSCRNERRSAMMQAMPRPLPHIPRGPRRIRRALPDTQLLGVPRIAPDWEMGALRALMKPQDRSRILHRQALQVWPIDAAQRIEVARQAAVERLGYDPQLHLPIHGDYRLVVTVEVADLPRATAFAVLLSHALPGLWLVLGPLYLKDGRFFRRERGLKLHWSRRTTSTCLALRAAIRGAVQ